MPFYDVIELPEGFCVPEYDNICIGFFSVREQSDCLYLETLQLIQQYRRHGISTKMFDVAESLARKKAKDKIRLRVIDGNHARTLYLRNGFETIEDQEWCVLVEKTLATQSKNVNKNN